MKMLRLGMAGFLVLAGLLMSLASAVGPEIPIIRVKGSINPGTGDYILEAIQRAESEKAPYLILELDTPGGLLETTRSIVQGMLSAKIPIVVFVGPKGAHAASAGALITLAADVAVMAPGTNMGAAHPVSGSGGSLDKTMAEKVANDTAAFAESIAKAKARNQHWSIRAVRNSQSTIAEEALKQGVIDFMAENVDDLLDKLQSFKLRVPKEGITHLPADKGLTKAIPMSVKQKLLAFFSDPNIAYLIMTLGGLCIWIELTHPGLMAPGVIGVICILISLITFQALPISYGALGLIFLGMAMIIAELFLPTYGLLGVGGIACFVLGSLFLIDTDIPAFQISLSLILPTAAVLAGSAFAIGVLVVKSRKTKIRSGMEALIGELGEVREVVGSQPGTLFIHGELWKAVSAHGDSISAGEIVVVTRVKDMILEVSRQTTAESR